MPRPAQALERLGRRDLVDEVEVDAEDRRRPGFLGDDVVVPDLLDDRARLGHGGADAPGRWQGESRG